uniref:PD-(D/E)XK nuclease superfamily protein n=1 Tax=Chryseobacterium sp. B5 TaxID=2050562 RepID=A0A2G7T910_9FLAO
MADEALVELCGWQRIGDEVLDVISLSENQHSDILGWLLDPREGHAQGDQILRDLLIAASVRFLNGESGLDGRSTTARFLKNWQPSRIRTTGFGSAFYARELGMKASERVDLFIIDSQNKFILLIENKAGAEHSASQLAQYRSSFIELVAANAHLRDYDHVYIALDRDFDNENVKDRPCSDTWIHLGYDWLKTSGDRARMHVKRGNAAAKLVVNYCYRQSDWESADSKKCTKLAATLHQRHPAAIRALIANSSGRIEKEWLTKKQPASSLLFMLQNKGVVELLRETQGMTSVKTELHSMLPEIPLSSIEHTRARLSLCPSGWEQPLGEWWPLFINVRFSDTSKTKFSLNLVCNSAGAGDILDAQSLRQKLAKVDSRFNSFAESQYRSVSIETGLSLAELSKRIKKLNLELQALAPVPSAI